MLDKTEKMDSSLPVSDESIKALEAQGFNTDMVQRLSSKMVEMDRANRSAGRQRTISSAQLGTLNMLQAGPYGRLRQCLAEIENRRVAVESTYWNYREQELEVEELLEKGSAIPDVSFRQGREEIHLKDLLGKRFILAFYPAAFTGG